MYHESKDGQKSIIIGLCIMHFYWYRKCTFIQWYNQYIKGYGNIFQYKNKAVDKYALSWYGFYK